MTQEFNHTAWKEFLTVLNSGLKAISEGVNKNTDNIDAGMQALWTKMNELHMQQREYFAKDIVEKVLVTQHDDMIVKFTGIMHTLASDFEKQTQTTEKLHLMFVEKLTEFQERNHKNQQIQQMQLDRIQQTLMFLVHSQGLEETPDTSDSSSKDLFSDIITYVDDFEHEEVYEPKEVISFNLI